MKCWCCGANTMVEAPELGSGWFKCANCEATWVKMLKVEKKAKKVKK